MFSISESRDVQRQKVRRKALLLRQLPSPGKAHTEVLRDSVCFEPSLE